MFDIFARLTCRVEEWFSSVQLFSENVFQIGIIRIIRSYLKSSKFKFNLSFNLRDYITFSREKIHKYKYFTRR